MLLFSIFVGKSALFGLRLLGRKGSALPGLLIERLYPQFLPKTLGTLPQGVIVVTGTNGKTTTTKIISGLLEAQGLRVLTNGTGSNFVRGIIATVAGNASFSGRLDYDIAVLEQDEAHAVKFVSIIRPNGVVALNVMRDQMDRFGEIDTTAKLIAKVAARATDWVVLNANDSRIATIADGSHPKKIIWFGHNEKLLPAFISDDQHHHKDDLTYFMAAQPDVMLTNMDKGCLELQIGQQTEPYDVRLDGSHNAINVAAAVAAMKAVVPAFDMAKTRRALERIEPAFGRGERVRLSNGAEVRLQLVKNPAGFTHSLRLLEEQSYDEVGMVINDADADGRDVSWLWDVDFEQVPTQTTVSCGGTRAHDMAVRLKYDQVATDHISTELDVYIDEIITRSSAEYRAIIFCTYTAMLQLRELLGKRSAEMETVSV